MQTTENQTSTQRTDMNVDKTLRSMILPFFLAIASFLMVDKMTNIETKMKRLEELIEKQIELKFEIKSLQQDVENLKLNRQLQQNSFPMPGEKNNGEKSPINAVFTVIETEIKKKKTT